MGRILMSLIILAVSCWTQTITVTKPVAGDVWYTDLTYTILWTKDGQMANTVRILLTDEALTTLISVIADLTSNSGSCQWRIPGNIPEGRYRVRVRASDSQIVGDSTVFNIKPGLAGKPSISTEAGLRIPPRIMNFSINNGAEQTDNLTVVLNYTAIGSPTHYRVQYERTRRQVWTDWMPWERNPSFTIVSQSCGERELGLQLKNGYGESNVATDTINYIYKTDRTIFLDEAVSLASPYGFRTNYTWKDSSDDIARAIKVRLGGIVCELGYPVLEAQRDFTRGMKADYEILAGKLLKPGWEFVSYQYPDVVSVGNPNAPDAYGKAVTYKPAPGGRDITLKVHLWRNILAPAVHFGVVKITLRGPCDQDISEAFKQQ